MDAVKAATYTSAKSLLIEREVGSIEVGKKADVILWNVDSVVQIPNLVSNHPLQSVIKNRKLVNMA